MALNDSIMELLWPCFWSHGHEHDHGHELGNCQFLGEGSCLLTSVGFLWFPSIFFDVVWFSFGAGEGQREILKSVEAFEVWDRATSAQRNSIPKLKILTDWVNVLSKLVRDSLLDFQCFPLISFYFREFPCIAFDLLWLPLVFCDVLRFIP